MRTRTITPEMFTPPQLAKLWGVSPDKIINLIRSGQLEAVNLATSPIGRPRYSISKAACERFKKSRQVMPELATTRRLRRKTVAGVKEYF